MKKTLLLIVLIVLLIFSGCSNKNVIEHSDTPSVVQVPEYSYFSLNVKYIDESEQPVNATDIYFYLEDGTVITPKINDGICIVEKFPAAVNINVCVKNNNVISASHFLSFWTGFDSAYYNNLQQISIDIPGNTASVFLTIKIYDNGDVDCVNMSEIDYDEDDLTENNNAYEQESVYGTKAVSETYVKLRSEPSTDSDVLRQMNFADVVVLLDSGQVVDGMTWYNVRYNDFEGYIAGAYLGRLFTINKNGVNMREQPTAESKSVNLLSAGARVVGLDDGQIINNEKWYKAITRNGIEGYIRSDFLG